MGEKTTILKESQIQLQSEKHRVIAQAIDEGGLRDRIKTAVNPLEHAPVEKQRAIYNNVIDFAEIYPTKVRLGVEPGVEPGCRNNWPGVDSPVNGVEPN